MVFSATSDYARYASGGMTPVEWLAYAPENFLQHNVLRIRTGQVRSGIIQAPMTDDSASWTVNRRSTVLGREKTGGGVFDLRAPGVAGPTLQVNWCGYKVNSLQMHMLQHPPNLMFTANMDGCTFAIGSAEPNGDRVVGHFNILDAHGTNVDEMAFAAHTAFGADAPLLDKTQYMVQHGAPGAVSPRGISVQTTTVGFFEGGAWRFFHQRYRQTGETSIEILDVRPIA